VLTLVLSSCLMCPYCGNAPCAHACAQLLPHVPLILVMPLHLGFTLHLKQLQWEPNRIENCWSYRVKEKSKAHLSVACHNNLQRPLFLSNMPHITTTVLQLYAWWENGWSFTCSSRIVSCTHTIRGISNHTWSHCLDINSLSLSLSLSLYLQWTSSLTWKVSIGSKLFEVALSHVLRGTLMGPSAPPGRSPIPVLYQSKWA
jgi:hypothetical protein